MTEPRPPSHPYDWWALSVRLRRDVKSLRTEIERLRALLQRLVDDVLEYERVNNLSPNPGRKYCWDSVAAAVAALERTGEPT